MREPGSPDRSAGRGGAPSVQITLSGGGPVIDLESPHGEAVLTRAIPSSGSPETCIDAADGMSWSTELVETRDSSCLSLIGPSAREVHAIRIRTREDSPLLEVTETLNSLDRRASPTDAFETRWDFAGGRIHEVFTPNLVPEPTDLIGQHMMRAPVLVAEGERAGVLLVVDIRGLARVQPLPAALLLERTSGDDVQLTVGLHAQEVRGHVFHRAARGPAQWNTSTVSHSYFLTLLDLPPAGATLAAARSKIWLSASGEATNQPLRQSAEDYARQIYPAALDTLWAETRLHQRRVGAITTSRSYQGDVWFSVWFSAWFNPVISAYGLFHFGRALGEPDWMDRARSTRALALSSPLTSGLFPMVFVFGEDRWVESHHQGGGPGIFHLMDMSWTMYQLLRWHRELEPDEEILDRAREYARAISTLQRDDGGLPAYVDAELRPVDFVDRAALLRDLENGNGDPYLTHKLPEWSERRFTESAEDAASLLFLSELASLLPPDDAAVGPILTTARAIARYLEEKVIPDARWCDFEVYFSCSAKDLDFDDTRSGQWPQNTLSMHHAAAGFLRLYRLTGAKTYLLSGRRVLDRLSLYQQVWSPPWLGLHSVGGYGAMNTDGEWNDARQAQFAETHLEYSEATGETEDRERALAAARSAFTTTFLPASAQRYSGWWREPHGMAAENHGHAGSDQLNGVSGFDWGSGAPWPGPRTSNCAAPRCDLSLPASGAIDFASCSVRR